MYFLCCNFFLIQIEEVEALSSIYGDEWCVIDEASRIFCIRISNDIEEPRLTACLQVQKKNQSQVSLVPVCCKALFKIFPHQIILPADYPSAAPPIYQIK